MIHKITFLFHHRQDYRFFFSLSLFFIIHPPFFRIGRDVCFNGAIRFRCRLSFRGAREGEGGIFFSLSRIRIESNCLLPGMKYFPVGRQTRSSDWLFVYNRKIIIRGFVLSDAVGGGARSFGGGDYCAFATVDICCSNEGGGIIMLRGGELFNVSAAAAAAAGFD